MALTQYVLPAAQTTITVSLPACEAAMDEGIKLLLERRKMYPEEFMRRRDRFYSKWVDFLDLWSIDLDDASTYKNVKLFGNGEFHKAVMRKLLEEEEKYLSYLDQAR